MKKILALLLALSLLCGCGADEIAVTTVTTTTPDTEASEDADASADTEPAGPLQYFTTEDLDGNEVTHEIYADYDLTVINIWGTFCAPCIQEMPDLGELSHEYADKGVQFVGLVGDAVDYSGNIDSSLVEEAKNIVEKTGADYLHLLPMNELLYNVMYQVTAYPTTVFVDSEGKQVDYAYMGAADKDTWAERIDAALELVKADE